MKSLILDKINQLLAAIQNFTAPLRENSAIIKNIEEAEFILISLLLILSTFSETNTIGLCAISVILISLIKHFLINGERISLLKADTALIIFVFLAIFSTYNSTLPNLSANGLVKYLIYIGYYFAIIPMFRKRRKKVLLIILLIAALCSLEAFYALLQSKTVIAGATWQDTSYVNPEHVISRIYGSLKPYNPNLLAGYLIATFPAVIGVTLLTIEKRHRKSLFIAICALITSLMAIFQTGCRGAYLGLIGIFLSYLLISYRIVFYDFSAFNYLKKLWINLTTGLICTSLIAIASMPKILHRIISIFLLRGDSSTSFRFNVYQSSFQMFLDNPFFGIGLGNQTFREIYGYYMITGFDALGAYSVPLEIAVETGIFGFIAFFGFIILMLINGIKYIHQDQSIRGKIYVAICISSITGLMAHGLFDTIFFRPQVQFIFWTMMALLNGTLSRKEIIEYKKEDIKLV